MKKRILIAGTVLTSVIALGGYTVANVMEDTCGFDPKTGYHFDGKGWSVNAGWDEAVACAKVGKLPDNVASSLGIYGDKKTQSEGRKWAAVNAKVKAEKAAKKAKEAAASAEKSAAKAIKSAEEAKASADKVKRIVDK